MDYNSEKDIININSKSNNDFQFNKNENSKINGDINNNMKL